MIGYILVLVALGGLGLTGLKIALHNPALERGAKRLTRDNAALAGTLSAIAAYADQGKDADPALAVVSDMIDEHDARQLTAGGNKYGQ